MKGLFGMDDLFGMDEALSAKAMEVKAAGYTLLKDFAFRETKFGEALSSSGWHSPYPLSYEKFDVHIKIWHIGYSIGADVTDSAGRTRWYMNTDDEWVEWLTKVELSEGYKHGG